MFTKRYSFSFKKINTFLTLKTYIFSKKSDIFFLGYKTCIYIVNSITYYFLTLS